MPPRNGAINRRWAEAVDVQRTHSALPTHDRRYIEPGNHLKHIVLVTTGLISSLTRVGCRRGGTDGDWADDRLPVGTHKCRYVRVLVGDLKEIGSGALPMVRVEVTRPG